MNIYQATVAFINTFKPGQTYTSEQFKAALKDVTDRGHRYNGQFSRPRVYQGYLRSAGFVSNVKRGVWRVNYHIPSWATLSALETACEYKGTQAQRKAVRAKIAEYKQAQPTWAFKIGDNVQVRTDETVYTIEQHPIRANDVYITWMGKDGKQSVPYTKAQINEYLTKKNPYWKLVEPKPVEAPKTPSFLVGDKVRFLASKTPTSFYNQADYIHPYDCFELVKEEQTPKPVETKKPRLMLCVDMSDSPADYTVGKVYELKSEDKQYYYFKRNDGGGGMFKYRFIEIKDVVENSVKVLCINNAGGYRDLLTVGKTYEAMPSKNGGEFWTIPVSDKGTSATAYKHRFKVVTEEITAPPISKYFNIGDRFKASTAGASEIVYLIKQKINSELVQVEWQSPRDPIGKLSTLNFDINQVSDHFAAGRWVKITEAPKQETPKKKVVYCIDNKMNYAAGELTIGKEYEVVEEDKKAGTITVVNDKGKMDWYRSTRFSDFKPKREWKVGDTLLSSFLNDSNIEKEFLGYGRGWSKYSSRMFVKDRKIEVIQEKEGKRAARISGTMDIWITLESLELHP